MSILPEYKNSNFLRKAFPCGLLFVFTSLIGIQNSFAVQTNLTPKAAISTDGKSYETTISIGMSTNGGASYLSSISVNSEVEIKGFIHVDPDHVGQEAEIFVVQRVGNSFTMKNEDGNFVQWGLSLKSLEPYIVGATLNENFEVEIFNGVLGTIGNHRIYIGYITADGDGLIFNPTPARFDVIEDAVGSFDFFEDNIADIIGSKCIVCHVVGGVADGQTELLYLNDANLTQENFDIFSDFFNSTPDAIDYILSKASGGDGHVGGIQLAPSSSEYNLLEQFLLMLSGEFVPIDTETTSEFFETITLMPDSATLRRAAIKIAGRLPTEEEKEAVESGNDNTLRQVLRDLMQGENFHEFLKDGANDRLLIRIQTDIFACPECYPDYLNRIFEIRSETLIDGISLEADEYNDRAAWGLRESPLELIAYVVESDLPYSEILTADYMMMSPLVNQGIRGTASFNNLDNHREFQPGIMTGYYSQDESVILEEVPFIGTRVIDPGNLNVDYPHAGVLNTLAFVRRYPTTATNRNRARARWTFFHFLGFDIEASAQRTTDPTALADTDNPTMKNPNCTVCHETMDPVAGSFQNYGPEGRYKESIGGMDSLDYIYKFPEEGNTPYQEGDTWYRDMRIPGFNQEIAPDSDNSLQWLAQKIVQDPRFSSAVVKFWWPAVFSSEILSIPEVESDIDYEAKLAAYDAQSETIQDLAERFTQSGMNLKDLLVEMIMSPWFRTESVDESETSDIILQAHEIADFGSEKLLTPEQLSKKTFAITGFNWLSNWDFLLGRMEAGLDTTYSLYYGGIDSGRVTERKRQMTSLMSTVPLTHALDSACPIVLKEFILPESERRLFAGIDEMTTPENGENQIREKLVELHEILLGQSYSTDAEEIDASFQLFTDSWNDRQNSGYWTSLFNPDETCSWANDIDFGESTGFPGDPRRLVVEDDGKLSYFANTAELFTYLEPLAEDPLNIKQSWSIVLAYLLSHYHYLYE